MNEQLKPLKRDSKKGKKRKMVEIDPSGSTREPQTPKVPEGTVADCFISVTKEVASDVSPICPSGHQGMPKSNWDLRLLFAGNPLPP